ncbi:hypothetical protein D6U66_18815, partial [Vibrio cholerae]|nr:hypothetical protein [Vibrio cholerae]
MFFTISFVQCMPLQVDMLLILAGYLKEKLICKKALCVGFVLLHGLKRFSLNPADFVKSASFSNKPEFPDGSSFTAKSKKCIHD